MFDTAPFVRCGRTGRAGQKGRSHTFLVAGDEQHAPSLIKVLGATRQDVPPLLVEVAHRWEVKAAKDAKKKAAAGDLSNSKFKY
jgi:superfamily II DNA/RNA helicase